MVAKFTARTYFPGLNALRFYAAMSVVVIHTATNFGDLRTRSSKYPLLDALALDAQSAVSLFFVLSGFLITYLLLKEHAETGTINVRRFYMRRILRIWPLYYLIALVGFIVLPPLLGPDYFLYDPSIRSTLLVFLFLPNFVGPLGPLGHLWTIGLEEQFYLCWPWVFHDRNRLLPIAFGVIIIKLAVAPVIASFNSDAMMNLLLGLRFECMAIGAIAAYLYFSQHSILRIIYSLPTQMLVIGCIIYLMLHDIPVTPVGNVVISVIFSALILNIATNERSLLKLNNPWFNRLGKISYGIYMYHFPLLYTTIFILLKLGIPEGEGFDFILNTVVIGGTLLLASISYHWFEIPFLRRKERFAIHPHVSDAQVP